MSNKTVLRVVDFVFWVATVVGTVVVVALVLGFAAGEGLLGAKYVLFVVGFLLFGLGSFGIQPTPPNRDERRLDLDGEYENRIEAAIQDVPPLRDESLPYDARIGRGPKLFVASLVILGVSALLEFAFGVGV